MKAQGLEYDSDASEKLDSDSSDSDESTNSRAVSPTKKHRKHEVIVKTCKKCMRKLEKQ